MNCATAAAAFSGATATTHNDFVPSGEMASTMDNLSFMKV
jgi:hypothetical protein